MAFITGSSSSVSRSSGGGFQQVVAAFLNRPGLPLASVLSAARVARAFAKHWNLFAMNGVYSTVNVLWAFLGQVLRDGQEAACQAAVAAITAQRLAGGLSTPTADTGDDCRARAKLSEAALRELTVEIAEELEAQADAKWLWKGRHAKLVDGFPVLPAFSTTRHEARHAREPGRVPAVSLAEAGCRVAHRAGHGHSVAGHGDRVGRGRRAVFRPGNRRNGVAAVAARFVLAGRPAGGRPRLLLVLPARAAGSRCAEWHAEAPAAARRFPPRMPPREARPSGRLDETAASAVDGPGDVRHDPRDDGAARTAVPREPAGLPHDGDHDRDHADRR